MKNYNEILENAAFALYMEYGINPITFLYSFELFSPNFFENTPGGCTHAPWVYIREKGTHSAFSFNTENFQIVMIKGKYYWPKSMVKALQHNADKDINKLEKLLITNKKDGVI